MSDENEVLPYTNEQLDIPYHEGREQPRSISKMNALRELGRQVRGVSTEEISDAVDKAIRRGNEAESKKKK